MILYHSYLLGRLCLPIHLYSIFMLYKEIAAKTADARRELRFIKIERENLSPLYLLTTNYGALIF